MHTLDIVQKEHGTNGLRRLEVDDKRFWTLSLATFLLLISLYAVVEIAERIAQAVL